MKNTKYFQLIFISFIISALATLHLSIFTEGFIITVSIVFLPFFIYLNEDLGALSICGLVAFLSPLVRYSLLLLEFPQSTAFNMIVPDIYFYITYGVIFHLLYERKNNRTITYFILAAAFCDFGSNIVEMIFREGLYGISLPILKGLSIVAIVRGFMLLLLLIFIKYYKSFLINQEHETRYRYLLNLTSTFKSELYFMQKNMAHIEEVMEESFKAYRMAMEQTISPELKGSLLNLTKEVHEIKKSYTRVIQGIKNTFPELMELSNLDLKSVVSLLELNTREQLKEENKVAFKCNLSGNGLVKYHYYFMSILANLVQNAIEASSKSVDPVINLNISAEEEIVCIKIEDNGPGIEPEHLEYIFNPGFSTKFDPKTGNINRGIGLTLIKDLIEEKFKGSVVVETTPGEGTIFSIELPKKILEEGIL